VVEKRPRTASTVLRGEDFGTVWEYQVRRSIRRIGRSNRTPRRGAHLSLQAVS
jgi:hypothetical protein